MNTSIVLNKKDDDDELETPPYHYREQTITQRIHHFYINDIVGEPSKFSDMIFKIQTASSTDVVIIHLNTPGGIITTGVQVINAMQASAAHVICSLEGEVASLGTMIFLAADEFLVHDNCLMMFHNYSGGVWGKGHEQTAALEATTKWTAELMERLYYPFMSKDEIDRIKKGDDLYFHSPEIRKRLQKMVREVAKIKKAEEAAAQKKKVTKKKVTPKRKP